MRIDPHTHSAYSDGTESPAALMAQAARAGLDVVGLTDHDTTAGWEEAAAAVPETGVTLLRGAEISCSANGIALHLLAYLFDPDYAPLADALAHARHSRSNRTRLMVQRLAADYPITWEGVLAQAADATTIGRPHIADALVAAGAFPDRAAAFAGPLATSSPYYVPYWVLDPVDACRLVRAAGGVPVAAHPRAANRQRGLVPDETFARMAQAGLAAIEVDHRDHGPAQRDQARALAQALGLGMSGASDYHGAGKPNRLGENLMPPALLEQIVSEGALALIAP
ncbi:MULTISPECIES: PHP domain-containing protein [unclassified Actinomyces]|uniref:PHP domain-containing protein n=1 Tax=unclassified Actinomyces TaxID=2609248 RepID=UPI0013A69CE1|nr:PHP domain-containing protein [Actinomyces sp. 594]MBW3070051.1 PHP domain-containing protein [Actinomyces sp. 594]NDR53816.1 PHP domain-containing protein [Actinomyces sp. 565]